MAGRAGHEAPSGQHHDGTKRACKAPECAAVRRAVERERWRGRQQQGGAPTGGGEAPRVGKSGAAARAWLVSQDINAEEVPAAADLLVVADTIDAATAGAQHQFIAALARQSAALRAELAPRTEPEDPEQPDGGQEAPGDGSSGDRGPERRSFDAQAL